MRPFVLPDVNVLIYAHRRQDDQQARVGDWLKERVGGEGIVLLTPQSIAGFLRVVTHPRVFVTPSPLELAIAFIDGISSRQNSVVVESGPRYWKLLSRLLADGDARGDLVPDASLAAVAMESGATLASCDRGFSRFEGLDWIDPSREGRG